MKRGTILIWIISVLLAANHLLFLSGSQRSADFWGFFYGLLCCYSFPFLILVMLRIPQNPSLERYIILTPYILIFIISILFPIRRFLPDYHPAELEGLAYLFIPVFESVLITVFFVAFVIIRLFRKGDLES
jgi:hypothetical protein